MERLYKVGIVIPAFNVERYIGECIDSILRQTYPNIVMAIVNDGSSDNTWKVIQKYMEHNPFVIRGIATDNKGVMQARLTCINLLEDCNYILFVDADDYLLDENIIEKCVEHMECADMVCFNMKNRNKNCFKSKGIRHMNSKEALWNMLNQQYMDGNICAGMYRYKYVKERFKVLACNNDDYINKASFIDACEKITVIPDVGYYYRVNSESQTHRKIKESDYMYYDHVCAFCRDIRKRYTEGFKNETEYFESIVLLWLVTGMHKDKESKRLNIYEPAMAEFSKRTRIYLTNRYFTVKDRITYLCIRLNIFRILYKMYHKLC